MKTKSTKFGTGIGKVIAAAAMAATKMNANSTCVFISHQPKLPKDAKKLRKF